MRNWLSFRRSPKPEEVIMEKVRKSPRVENWKEKEKRKDVVESIQYQNLLQTTRKVSLLCRVQPPIHKHIALKSQKCTYFQTPVFFIALPQLLLLHNSHRRWGAAAMHDAACCSVAIRLHVTLNGVYFDNVMVADILLLLSRVCAPALFWPNVIVVKCPQDQRDAPKNRSP
jgi:hypothetical protein